MAKGYLSQKLRTIISTILVGLLLILGILFVGIRIFGFTPYIVLSGSMEPEYPVGSLIYVKAVEPESVEPGDPITYTLNEGLQVITHRVVVTDHQERQYRTKGDANESMDGHVVHYHHLLGKPVFVIPGIGYLAHFVSQPPSLYISMGVMMAAIILFFYRGDTAHLSQESQSTENNC